MEILIILFVLVVLKMTLPQPQLGEGQTIGFFQYKCGGVTYAAKIIADSFIVACLLVAVLVFSAHSHMHGRAEDVLFSIALFGPFLAPLVFLLMRSARDRTIRFSVSVILAAVWFLMNMPAI